MPTLAYLIQSGGPITITHPEATRFFMTIPEACELVLQAGLLGEGPSVFVLDMGEPVSILGLAKRMIEMSGKKIDIVFTGLRKGEKLHEELFSNDEVLEESEHNLIYRCESSTVNPGELEGLKRLFTAPDLPDS